MNCAVLFYVPNCVGYVRLFLIVVAWFLYHQPVVFLVLYSLSTFLDGVDGCLARRLNQVSSFGAWLDVWIDNVGRTLLWTRLHNWGVFLSCLEWTVFVCTHSPGGKWKASFSTAPWWAKAVMDNGFYTPPGVFAIAGIHVLPIYLYYYQNRHVFAWSVLHRVDVLLTVPIVVLAMGRLLALAVELWVVQSHLSSLAHIEEDKHVRSLTVDLGGVHSDSGT